MDLRIILIGILVCMARSASTKIQVEVEEELPPGSFITILSDHPEVTGSMRREDLQILTYLMVDEEKKHSVNSSHYISVEKSNGSVTVSELLCGVSLLTNLVVILLMLNIEFVGHGLFKIKDNDCL